MLRSWHFSQLVTLVPKGEEPVKGDARPQRSSKSSNHERKTIARAKAAQPDTEVKKKEKENVVKADEDKPNSRKRRVVNPNNVRVNDLPDFAKDQTWKKTFLPTLYDKFFTSSSPFSQFVKGSKEFIALLQVVMKDVYPKVQYKISATEAIHAIVHSPRPMVLESLGLNY